MREIRPTSDDELKRVKVDTDFLGIQLASKLNSLLGQEFKRLAVSVNVEEEFAFASSCEWRLNLPPKEPKLYVALSELADIATTYYNGFVSLGKMRPKLFVVCVWIVKNNEPSINGSWD